MDPKESSKLVKDRQTGQIDCKRNALAIRLFTLPQVETLLPDKQHFNYRNGRMLEFGKRPRPFRENIKDQDLIGAMVLISI